MNSRHLVVILFPPFNLTVFRKQFPTMKQGDILKKAAEEWKLVPEAKKATMVSQFQKEKEQWSRKMESVPESVKEAARSAKKGKKVAKVGKSAITELKTMLENFGKPKKPSTSYFMFCSDMRLAGKVVATDGVPKNAKIMSQQWKSLPAPQRQAFDDKYEKEKEAYEKALSKWSAKMAKEGKMAQIEAAQNRINSLKKEMRELKEE